MKTRTIPELLQILLDNEEHFESGLCILLGVLCDIEIINNDEYNLMDKYLKANLPPKIFSERNGEFTMFCFPYDEWPPRKEWLENKLNLLKI